jgi:hypothetical protein
LKFLLLASPSSDQSGGPALFASLQATFGRPINLYAGADTRKWAGQIDAVLEWDASTPNGSTSKTRYRRQWEEARGWLLEARDQILAHAAEIQKQREQQGIGQVGVMNGVYIEELRARMPADWPPLESTTPVDRVVGRYKANFRLGLTLFPGDGPKTLRATTFAISKAGSNGLILVAERGDDELLRRSIAVREEGGAIVFEEDSKPDYMSDGGIHATTFLRVNTAGDLVVQSDLLTERKSQGKSMPVRELSTFWYRTMRAD